MLGNVNKHFVSKSLLTRHSNVLPLYLKQTFPPIIWIFTEGEGDGIESRLPFKFFYTLWNFPFRWYTWLYSLEGASGFQSNYFHLVIIYISKYWILNGLNISWHIQSNFLETNLEFWILFTTYHRVRYALKLWRAWCRL